MGTNKCGVYEIRCRLNGKVYIGSSKQIYVRWSQHRTNLRKGKSNCRILQKAWTKHGEGAFQFSVLEECSADELEAREQWFIDTICPEYNLIIEIRRRYNPEGWRRAAEANRARAALITHCPRGHAYDEANTYRNKKGKRICRACNALRVTQYYEAEETPEQREIRLQQGRDNHQKNKPTRLAKMREYTVAHKEEKRAYDKSRRQLFNEQRRKRLANETQEQKDHRMQLAQIRNRRYAMSKRAAELGP